MVLVTIKPKMLRGTIEIPKLNDKSEGDFYYAAYFLVAGAIGNDIICKGIKLKSGQKNAKIIEIIREVGGIVEETEDGIFAKMTAVMHGIEINCKELAEILPAVALLCAFCKGESRIYGVADMAQRSLLKGIASEFSHLGISTDLMSDGLLIRGGQTINGDGTYAWNSSSLATALYLLASRSEGEIRVMGIEDIKDKKFDKFRKLYEKLTEDK